MAGCAAESEPPADRWEGVPFVDAMIGCLQDRGWDAQANGEDSYRVDVPPQQSDRYDQDRSECMDETGYASAPPPLSRADLEVWYQELLVTAECVRGRGYQIQEAPSMQTFLDQVESREVDGLWGPYPGGLSASDWAELEVACPQPGAEEAPQQSF